MTASCAARNLERLGQQHEGIAVEEFLKRPEIARVTQPARRGGLTFVPSAILRIFDDSEASELERGRSLGLFRPTDLSGRPTNGFSIAR